ncbi:MAG: hypothetical protein ACEQSB_00120 [Undibacterium sp.]
MITVPVHILIIHHRQGENVTAHASHEEARKELYDYCLEEWSSSRDPLPQDHDEAIDEYFENYNKEFAEITESEIAINAEWTHRGLV